MDSRSAKIGLVTTTTFLLVMTLVVNYLSTSQIGRNSGLFENSSNSNLPWNQRGNLTDCGLTPPGWAFGVWGVIYLYQAVMLAYTWSLLFRRVDSGAYLCCVPGLLPSSALVLHSVTSLLNIAWVFLADRVNSTPWLLVPQTLAIVLLAAVMALVVGVSYRGIVTAAGEGLSCREVTLSVVLWLNANGLYLGWVTVASFLNIDIAIINLSDWQVDQSDLLCLANIVLIFAAYSVLDLTCLRLRLLYTPYLTAIWALATSVVKNYGPQKAASLISIEAAIALALVLTAKIALAALGRKCRAGRLPMHKTQLSIPLASSKSALL